MLQDALDGARLGDGGDDSHAAVPPSPTFSPSWPWRSVALRDPVWQLAPPRRKFSSVIQRRFRFRFWWAQACGSSILPDRTISTYLRRSRGASIGCGTPAELAWSSAGERGLDFSGAGAGDSLRLGVVPGGHCERLVPERRRDRIASDARLDGERRVRPAQAVRSDDRRLGDPADAPDREAEPV